MTYIIAEIGINHNGDLDTALDLIRVAAHAGADAVKFQKRTPSVCVPKSEWNKRRDTPWGEMSYIDYRERMEFGHDEFRKIDQHCKNVEIDWFASAWDEPSVEFLKGYQCPYIKIPSAKANDVGFIDYVCEHRGHSGVILSTGACDAPMIRDAVDALSMHGPIDVWIMHCTSTYPCPVNELNLNAIKTLKDELMGFPIGYSGHETGIPTTIAAAALLGGVGMIERHITLDRTSWGSDHAASLEPEGLRRLVNGIRAVDRAMGDGELKIFDSERKAMKRLRAVA